MAYIGKRFRNMLAFVAFVYCAAYLSFVTGAEINKDPEISRWRWDDDDDDDEPWWKKSYTTTKEPYIPTGSSIDAGSTVMLVGVFLATLVVGCGLTYCLKYMCESGECTFTTTSPPTPNRVIIPPPRRNIVPPPENTRTIVLQIESPVASASPFFSIFRGATGNSSVSNDATDKPPGYDDVALSDLKAQKTKFPEVKPSVCESPPPKYDESTLKY